MMLQEALEAALAEKEALFKRIASLEASMRETEKVQADQVRQIERLKAQVPKLYILCVPCMGNCILASISVFFFHQ
jgi:hypothetical protein